MGHVVICLMTLLCLVSVGMAETDKKSAILKAQFIYVGPIGDYGWTYAHD